jgi:hypothetical protein
MQASTQSIPVSSMQLWTGRVLSGIPVLMLFFSGAMKLMKPPAVVLGFAHSGYSENLISVIGLLEISCTLVYLIPRTAVLGAILMTAYLGGATATNVRVGDRAYLATIALGILVWLGLYFRDLRLRELVPLRK